MNAIFITAALIMTTSALAGTKVIYGKDNRKDIYQVSNAMHLKLAKSTAGMINIRAMTKSGPAEGFDLIGMPSLERSQNLCTSEAFASQTVAPNCSGFLVGPDLIVTAGHCYKSMGSPEATCKSFAWVFDYDMKSAKHDPTKNISINDVYLCKQVVHAQLDGSHDFSIIKLDRKVVGRTPLKFRTSGKIDSKASLLVIGHPSGLPTKVSDGAKITKNTLPTTFSTNLDTFAGNSGSAVFDALTGQVEGILIQGKTDYRPSINSNSGSCQVANHCDESGQRCEVLGNGGPVAAGEVVYRMEQIAARITKAMVSKK